MKNEKDRFNKKFNQTWDRQTDRQTDIHGRTDAGQEKCKI